jgi:hypothetical protein
MSEFYEQVKNIRQRHPVFFWGSSAVLILLLVATAVVAMRIPLYRAESANLDRTMTTAEREVRDRILNSRARRSELALALLQRELRLRSLEQDEVHLAIEIEGSTLALRHGAATLRETPISIGPDSTVRAPDGTTWRLVRALGERHIQSKDVSPTYMVPDWWYVSRGEVVPPEPERRVEGGLGRYVLRLDDGTAIHTRPETGPFSDGLQPAAFIVEDEAEMRAIFDALSVDTPVYIY